MTGVAGRRQGGNLLPLHRFEETIPGLSTGTFVVRIKHEDLRCGLIEMYTSIMYIMHIEARRSFFVERAAMTIEEILVKQYGPLLSLAELGLNLDRSPEGLCWSPRSSREGVGRINAARLRLGRRVHFRASEIANVLDAR